MRKRTKFFLPVILFFFFVSACSDNNPTEADDHHSGAISSISGKISDWTFSGYKLKLVADTDLKAQYVAAETDVNSNGEFNLSSLKDVPADYLYPLRYELQPGVNCDNPNLKTVGASLLLYQNGQPKGEVVYSLLTPEFPPVGSYTAYYYYADGEAKVTGSTNYTEYYKVVAVFDISVKKGWNVYYEHYASFDQTTNTLTIKYTSEKPSGDGTWNYSF